jgi:hypothetical protein
VKVSIDMFKRKSFKYKIQSEGKFKGMFHLYKFEWDLFGGWWKFLECSFDFCELTEFAANDANPKKHIVLWESEIRRQS